MAEHMTILRIESTLADDRGYVMHESIHRTPEGAERRLHDWVTQTWNVELQCKRIATPMPDNIFYASCMLLHHLQATSYRRQVPVED